MIQVDIDSSIIGRAKPITIGIEGDCKIYLKQMLEEVKKTGKVEKRKRLYRQFRHLVYIHYVTTAFRSQACQGGLRGHPIFLPSSEK